MDTNFIQFIQENIATISALLGVIIGGFLTYITTVIGKKKETQFRVTEKILDRRIEALEALGKFAYNLSNVAAIGHYKDKPDLVLIPHFMLSKKSFENMFGGAF